ncbi:MAG: hypothetical protein ACRDT8_00040 [Micromonosporaceae bacterium]
MTTTTTTEIPTPRAVLLGTADAIEENGLIRGSWEYHGCGCLLGEIAMQAGLESDSWAYRSEMALVEANGGPERSPAERMKVAFAAVKAIANHLDIYMPDRHAWTNLVDRSDKSTDDRVVIAWCRAAAEGVPSS